MEKRNILIIGIVLLFFVGLVVSGYDNVLTGKASETKECNDKLDNDRDGLVDLADKGCKNTRDNDETNCGDNVCEGGEDSFSCTRDCGTVTTECNDGLDNDGDSLIDYPGDAGCSSISDNDETNCGDGVCEGGETPSSCSADCITECSDGIDNDGDGHIDLADSKCANSSDNDETPRDFCNDTDNGFNLNLKGTASGEDGGISFSSTDSCINATTVWEFTCGTKFFDYDLLSTDSECLNATVICSDGACF